MLDSIINSFLTDKVWQIAEKYNMDPDQAKSIAKVVLPLIIKGISDKTKDSDSSTQLMQAASEHNEQNVEDVDTNDGLKMLTHLFDNSQAVTQTVATNTNSSPEDTSKVMATLAPLVMSYINSQQKTWQVDATNINKQIEDNSSIWDKDGIAMQLATKFLDQNGDGNITDDLIKKWMDYFNNSSDK